eukprot:TRINITY_DN11675_c1_g1_i1.p1 TRINITY_DN11675_c1_g1~~TRINITY_DN11675_c1_g1_i1.p1  ORF type:complete len:523 (+),score=78.72 TRINITY_DN11675_c1_g1_i1:163-1731(+)
MQRLATQIRATAAIGMVRQGGLTSPNAAAACAPAYAAAQAAGGATGAASACQSQCATPPPAAGGASGSNSPDDPFLRSWGARSAGGSSARSAPAVSVLRSLRSAEGRRRNRGMQPRCDAVAAAVAAGSNAADTGPSGDSDSQPFHTDCAVRGSPRLSREGGYSPSRTRDGSRSPPRLGSPSRVAGPVSPLEQDSVGPPRRVSVFSAAAAAVMAGPPSSAASAAGEVQNTSLATPVSAFGVPTGRTLSPLASPSPAAALSPGVPRSTAGQAKGHEESQEASPQVLRISIFGNNATAGPPMSPLQGLTPRVTTLAANTPLPGGTPPPPQPRRLAASRNASSSRLIATPTPGTPHSARDSGGSAMGSPGWDGATSGAGSPLRSFRLAQLRSLQQEPGGVEELAHAAAARVMSMAALPPVAALESILSRTGSDPGGAAPVCSAVSGSAAAADPERERLGTLVLCGARRCVAAAVSPTRDETAMPLPVMPLTACYGADEATWWRVIYKAVKAQLAAQGGGDHSSPTL